MPLTNTFNPSSVVNTTTDYINISSHGFIAYQGVTYSSGGGTAIGGLVSNYKYYVIYVDSDNIKLALTEDDARAGTAIDLLSTGSGTTHSLTTTNTFPNSAAYYDFYRRIRLVGPSQPVEGITLEADSVRDSLTLVEGSNIVFENVSTEQDTFTISGPDYDLEVPVGTTDLRLYSSTGDDQTVKFSVDRGINITRVAADEIRFEGLGVTETDTLHSVSSRGNITSNTLYLNNLEVGVIQSVPGEDGVTGQTTTGTTGTAVTLTGNGTLDSPLEIDLAYSSEASKTLYVNFTVPASGTMSYSASYKAESTLTTGSVILQREDPLSPGSWTTIDSATGTTERTAYTIQNIYAEPNTGTTNFRIITTWTGLTTGYVDFPISVGYEISPIAVNEMIVTDTSTGVLDLGRLGGTVNIRGTISILDTIETDGLRITQNNIVGTNSNDDIVIDPNGTGGIEVRTTTIKTDQTSFNLINTTATTVNFAGAATTVEIGAATGTTNVNNNLTVDLDLQVKGGDLTTNQTTFNLLNTTPTTVNAFDAATSIDIGAATGTTNINNNLVVDLDLEVKGGDITTDQTTFNLLNTTATTVNAFGAATTINLGSLIITGNTIDTSDSSGITVTPTVTFDSDISANDISANNATFAQNLTVQGDLTVNGTTVTLNTTTLDVEDLNVTVAKGAVNGTAANGAGLTVDGAGATLTYASLDDSWNFNKLVKASSLENTPIGTVTRAAGNFTTLDANSTVGLSPSNATVTISPTGTGTVTINPATAGTINNTSIGATTAAAGRFTTLKVKDTSASFDLSIVPTSASALTGDRSLTINVADDDRVLKLAANVDISSALTILSDFQVQSGSVILTAQPAGSNITLPASGTLVTTSNNLSALASTTSSQLAGVISDETGSGALVFGTSPTLATPDITFMNAAVTGNGDYAYDASTTSIASWIASFTATRNLVISNLTAGRMIRVYVRNTNASARAINVNASTTTTGHAAVNLAGNFVGANAAGQASATSVTLAATSGTAVITVWNAGGSIVGMVN